MNQTNSLAEEEQVMATIYLCQAACACHDDAFFFNDVRRTLGVTDRLVQLDDLRTLKPAERPLIDLALFFLRPRSSFDAAFGLLTAVGKGIISLPLVWHRHSGQLTPGMDYLLKFPVGDSQRPALFYEDAKQVTDAVAQLLGRTLPVVLRSRSSVADGVTVDGPLFEQARAS